MVAGNQRQHLPATLQLQRVHDLRAAERLVHHFRARRRVVVVHHVVGPQQHVGEAALATGVATDLAGSGNGAVEDAKFDLHLLRTQYLAGQECALADEVGDEAVGRAMVEVVGRVPLLDAALVQDP